MPDMGADSERMNILFRASKLDPSFTSDDVRGPGKYEGASDPVAAACILIIAGDGTADETAGEVATGRALVRIGRYVAEEDGDGNVDVMVHATESDAIEALARENERVALIEGE